MRLTPRHAAAMLAPYLAVGVFWCALSNAWLAILAYHAQILFWRRGKIFSRPGPPMRSGILIGATTVLAGPAIWVLLPYLVRADLASWLADYRMSDLGMLLMIPYFGLLHPWLEQVHWAPLREETPLAHPIFAGYHMLVLYSLLTPPWLVISFVVLTGASIAWQVMQRKFGGLAAPIVSHVFADLGIVVAAWIRM